MSRITFSGPAYFSRRCPDAIWVGGGHGVAVLLDFHNLHLAGLRVHRRIIAGLYAPAGAGRIYQRWASLEHSFPVQVSIRPEMGLISEEDLRPHLLRFG